MQGKAGEVAQKEGDVMKFSLIIPFYNAGPWIGRCLDSCLDQDLPEEEYELILVDDGSTDNGRSVAVEKLSGRKNAVILSQENSGQAVARNRALDIAKGEFVWFVDADDWIERRSLGGIAAMMESADILAISGADWKDGRAARRFGWKDYGIIEGRRLMCCTKINVGTPFSIYRRSLLDGADLRFMEGVYHEDAEFAPRAYYSASRVKCTDRILYYVFPSPGSTTRSSNPKRVFDYIEKCVRSLSDFCDGIEPEFQVGFHNLISSDITHALKNVTLFDDATNRKIGECLYSNRDLFRHMRRSSVLKFRLEGLIFTIFPRRTVVIMKTFLTFAVRSRAERKRFNNLKQINNGC